MLSCTMILHLALVSALIVMTAILLQWCWIRSIIIITFGTTSVVMHNDITFGAGIGIDSHDCNIVTVVLCQDIVRFSTVPK